MRIHLAQISYLPAYYDTGLDCCAEPCNLQEGESPLSTLHQIGAVQATMAELKGAYISHISKKLSAIATWSKGRDADLLVFPEYSVPAQSLPDLQAVARGTAMTIVAGTHRIALGQETGKIYGDLGLFRDVAPVGCACAPVVSPDGSLAYALKLKKSKWEPNLSTPSDMNPTILALDVRGEAVRMAVVPCIDSLHPEVVGKLFESESTQPHLLVCPSLSPSVDPFKTMGSVLQLKDTPFFYVNSTAFGGTHVNYPESWQSFLPGIENEPGGLPAGVEAVMEIDIDPQHFYRKVGSVQTNQACRLPWSYPIVYEGFAPWSEIHSELIADVDEWLSQLGKDGAIDVLDSYLSLHGTVLPPLLRSNLVYLRHSILPFYDGKADVVNKSLELVSLDNSIMPTDYLFAQRVDNTLRLLLECIKSESSDKVSRLFSCIETLKKNQERLPTIMPDVSMGEPGPEVRPSVRDEVIEFSGEEDLATMFQNREDEIGAIRRAVNNPNNKVILITGPLGVGKSTIVNALFRKVLTDWDPVRVHIAGESNVPRLVADIAYKNGSQIDADFLSSSSQAVFAQRLRDIALRFYSVRKRALVIDDLQEILRSKNSRSLRQLDSFMDVFSDPKSFVGGRVFLLSSVWVPDRWRKMKGVLHLQVPRLSETCIQAIFEYHLRRTKLVDLETPPEIPQELLEVINGHPLSARLLVEAMQNEDLEKMRDELVIAKFAGRVARELLARMTLTREESELMCKMSIFRLPVRMEHLRRVPEFAVYEEELMALAVRGIIGYDGQSFAMHEAVRRYFADQAKSQHDASQLNQLGKQYYQMLYNEQQARVRKDPAVLFEFVHHLSMCGEIDKANDLRLIVIEEIKPTARRIYRELKDYRKALSLFKLVSGAVPDDAEVWAYIGRCHARLQHRADCDSAFERAVQVAGKSKRKLRWIHRDWGHILARFDWYEDAMYHLQMADAYDQSDPSTKAAMAYVNWRNGDTELAERDFELALVLNPNHIYTLIYYPQMLDELGHYAKAKLLRDRLAEIEDWEMGKDVSSDYESDLEDFDIDWDDS